MSSPVSNSSTAKGPVTRWYRTELHILPKAFSGSCGNVVGYYPSWAYYRNGIARYTVEDIPVGHYTHLIYAFAKLGEDFTLQPFDPYLDIDLNNYEKFVHLKRRNPQVKVLLGVGGWNDSQSNKYSRMVASSSNRRIFVNKAVELLLQYGFDGLDLDWQYPKYNDREGFTCLVQELKDALSSRGLLLTAALSAGREVVENGYDVPQITKYLDLINLMAYDFHGFWENEVAHHAPLNKVRDQNREYCIDDAVNYWIKKGAPKHKIVLGVPFYGRSWTLASSRANTPGSAASGKGNAGQYIKEKGQMAFFECSLAHQRDGWAKGTGDGGPYLTKDNQWVGYDDKDAIARKVQYARNKSLGGIMVWDIASDEFQEGRNTLINAISENLK